MSYDFDLPVFNKVVVVVVADVLLLLFDAVTSDV